MILLNFFFFLEKPFFHIQPTDVTVPAGNSATFQCSVKGGKNPKISWYYGSRVLSQHIHDSDTSATVNKNDDLIISNTIIGAPKTVVCSYEDSIINKKKYSGSVSLKVIGKLWLK